MMTVSIFRVVRLRLGLLGGWFLHLFRNGGRRALLLCRSMARGQHTCQEEGGAAAEKRPSGMLMNGSSSRGWGASRSRLYSPAA